MASKEGRMSMKCASCSVFRPGRAWNDHSLCLMCRLCSRRESCSLCFTFSPENWAEVDTWMVTRREKSQSRLARLSPTPAFATDTLSGSTPDPRVAHSGETLLPVTAVYVNCARQTANELIKGKASHQAETDHRSERKLDATTSAPWLLWVRRTANPHLSDT